MSSATYNANAVAIYKFWTSKGLTPAQACGLLAQADAESSLEPNAVGDHHTAFGLDQWHQPRVDAILRGTGINIRALPPLEKQLEAAHWELTHTERAALVHIEGATSAYEAGYLACRYWERPGSSHQWALRGQRAEAWHQHFKAHGAD